MSDAELDAAYESARALLGAYLRAPAGERRAFVESLRPTAAELPAIFVDAVVDDVQAGYRMLWANQPVWPVEDGCDVSVVCLRAADFLHPSPLSHQFPGGYRSIARFLLPRATWCAWRFAVPGRAASSSFDGLVRSDGGQWRWCPRPWRVLPQPPRESPWLWNE